MENMGNTIAEGISTEIGQIDLSFERQGVISHQIIISKADIIIARLFHDDTSPIALTEEESAILALASVYALPIHPEMITKEVISDIEKYQSFLYQYLGVSLIDQIQFLQSLVNETKKNEDHIKLLPIFQTFYAQIHVLKLVYIKFKKNITRNENWTPENRILLGLIAAELAKLHVRYYLVEEKVGTENRQILSWVEVFDWIFDHFGHSDIFSEKGLGGLWADIKSIRDRISHEKTMKLQVQVQVNAIILSWKSR